MMKYIFQIYFVLSVLALAQGTRPTRISTHVLNDFSTELNIDPFVKVGDKLYHFGQSKVSWYQATLICRSMGGFLASFDSQQEMTALSNYLIAKYPTDRWWWLSGSDLQSEGDFFWYSTGERIQYADWSHGQPDNAGGSENCVHLWYQKPKYQMNDWICNQPAYYICEADRPKTIAVSIF